MAKVKTQYLCTECGDTNPTWLGKCPNCGAFNTLKEFREAKLKNEGSGSIETGVDLTIASNRSSGESTGNIKRLEVGKTEIDRVLGGGFFPGSITLFGGHPGIGKSTLSLQIFLELKTGFYFSGEESRDQVFNRAERLLDGADSGGIKERIFSTNALEDIITTVQTHKPSFVVVDSIQMVGLQDSRFGSVSQIRENAEVLLKLAKSTNTTILIIGHVTKNDELAGPKVLEHLVDVVLYLEGERNSELRLLRAPKNRFGSTLEVGVFEMRGAGLQALSNPAEFFLAERALDTQGSVITALRDGVRNFVLELQVLTVKTNFGQPRRTSHGFDLSKFHLLLAVVAKFTPFTCEQHDGYLNVIGGLRITDPAADLAIVAAVLSSRLEKEIPADTVVLGEVGLSGEVRRVQHLDARLVEIAKLGFTRVVCPKIPKGLVIPEGLSVEPIKTVSQLLPVLFGKN
jgi:DNA repair protein RadA/Sms